MDNEKLRDLAFKRDLMMKTINSEVKEAEARGRAEGEARGKYNSVIKIFKRKYPKTDTTFLEGLTLDQYDQIFDMLLDGEGLEAIFKVIH